MSRVLIGLFSLMLSLSVIAQEIKIDKIEPPNWWEGMKHNKIQLMVYGEDLSNISVKSEKVKITKINELENDKYLFVNIDLSEIAAGEYQISFSNGKKDVTINYPIFERVVSSSIHQGFDQEDVIYLIMPDRLFEFDCKTL